MKKILIAVLGLVMMSSVYADDFAKLSIKISAPVKNNSYFLCLYGVGCLNATSGSRGKEFGISPFDMGNITKIVITDSNTMRMYEQPNPDSCNVTVKSDQKLTITGTLQVKNATPYISNLQCRITQKNAVA